MPQAGGSLSNASLIGSLTDESTPKRSVPLDGYDALRILTRLYRFLLYGYQIENAKDLVARLDAERDVMRLRSRLNRELFGWDV
jgi:hypothetical protein